MNSSKTGFSERPSGSSSRESTLTSPAPATVQTAVAAVGKRSMINEDGQNVHGMNGTQAVREHSLMRTAQWKPDGVDDLGGATGIAKNTQ